MHPGEMFTITTTNPQVCGAYGLELPELLPDMATQSCISVKDGDIIKVGSLRLEVLETPGHSRGGLCFYERTEGVLFSGDTLFAGAIGRTDHPGGDYDSLMKSIFEKLMVLDGQVAVIPGHGPETDIATERNTNPFLMPFNEPFEDEE
jgi:glyoxylase-like metal-dependent hydrolase (beta-lactamase superfamily II)